MKIIKDYWFIFSLIGIQVILILLKIYNILKLRWVYILMPTWIILSLILLVITFAIYEYKYFDRNGMN